MPRNFFDPTPERQNVVLVNAAIKHEAERLIESCEGCTPEGAEIPFDLVLRVTGSDPNSFPPGSCLYIWSEGLGRKSIERSVCRFCNWFRSFCLKDLFELVGRLDDLLQQTLSFLLQLLQRGDDRHYPSPLLGPLFWFRAEHLHVATVPH